MGDHDAKQFVRTLADLPPCDPKTIAPVGERGFPDLYNYMPTRLIPRDEAMARGWHHFYDASICRYGHQAPRYTKNPRLCVDCVRIKDRKQTIGGRASGIEEYALKTEATKVPVDVARAEELVPDHVKEPDPKEKKFLESYAKLKDIDRAAMEVGLSGAQIEARLSWSVVFRTALNQLEERIGIKKTVSPTARFFWSADKRKKLIEVYVDTGDLATARDSIRVTPSEYFRELSRTPEFDDAIKEATALAERALEERAIQLALAGNDKLLTKILSAKKPEYRERVNVDMNVTEKLDDRQLESRLARLIGKYRGRVIEGEYQELKPERSAGAITDARGTGETTVSEQVPDPVPRQGAV